MFCRGTGRRRRGFEHFRNRNRSLSQSLGVFGAALQHAV